jgi:pimeloyl-ACP methyl ester carboxylesterase
MNQTAECRELFILDNPDTPVHGTRHKTARELCGEDSRKVGLVFLNGLLTTRSGHGDSVAYWADSFAEAGYPSYRIDLPGYGDSPGEPREDWLGQINTGGYAEIAAAKIRELALRFGLSGVVLVGQCAGAVTAIFAARHLSECRGLILLEPYFFLPEPPTSTIRQGLHRWRLQSSIGAKCRKVYQHFKALFRALGGRTIPRNANFALLDRWKHLASDGVPALLVTAYSPKDPGQHVETGEFDYLTYIAALAKNAGTLTIETVEDATHTFANRQGRVAVRNRTLQWLSAKFSQDASQASVAPVAELARQSRDLTWHRSIGTGNCNGSRAPVA